MQASLQILCERKGLEKCETREPSLDQRENLGSQEERKKGNRSCVNAWSLKELQKERLENTEADRGVCNELRSLFFKERRKLLLRTASSNQF